MKKRYRNTRVVKKISDETGIHPSVVDIIIRSYFRSMRKFMKRHIDLTVTGFFKLKLRTKNRQTINKKGNRHNFKDPYGKHKTISHFVRKARKKNK